MDMEITTEEITTEVHDVQDGVIFGELHIKKTSEMSQELHQKLEQMFDRGVSHGASIADVDDPDEEEDLYERFKEDGYPPQNELYRKAYDLGFDVGHTNVSLDE